MQSTPHINNTNPFKYPRAWHRKRKLGKRHSKKNLSVKVVDLNPAPNQTGCYQPPQRNDALNTSLTLPCRLDDIEKDLALKRTSYSDHRDLRNPLVYFTSKTSPDRKAQAAGNWL